MIVAKIIISMIAVPIMIALALADYGSGINGHEESPLIAPLFWIVLVSYAASIYFISLKQRQVRFSDVWQKDLTKSGFRLALVVAVIIIIRAQNGN